MKILLINMGTEPFTVSSGDRIAQIVFTSVTRADFKKMDNLKPTPRGSGGFGSTGV